MRRAETIEAMGQRARALVAPHAAERVVDAAAALAWRSETSRDAA
jgi:hypothetical protein